MRGIVTLAATLALPAGFPLRDLIVFTAFCVVLGTLVIQGMTLRPLLSSVTMATDDTVEREVALARAEGARAVLAELEHDLVGKAGGLLRADYAVRLDPEEQRPAEIAALISLRRRAVAAERRSALRLRREGRIGDDAFHQLEEVLDWAEAETDVEQGRL